MALMHTSLVTNEVSFSQMSSCWFSPERLSPGSSLSQLLTYTALNVQDSEPAG